MPAPATQVDYLDLLRRSGLIDAGRLENYLSFKDGSLPDDPRDLAATFVLDGLLTQFQAKQLLQGRHRGFVIGRYRLLEVIGTGGMSKVYLCQHQTMGHRVAMKVLPDTLASDPQAVDQFHREARAIAALNHPNIVRAHDLDRHGGHYYLIMDYVEGVSLQDLVKRHGPMQPGRAANCIVQAAWGLQHIYEAGLVHRDVKPGNLLLDRQGVVRILDLGLARFHETDAEGRPIAEHFDSQTIVGTADYLAPEQAMRSHDVDIRGDIYSLGATFYFLLAGRAPFEEQTLAQKLLSHQLKNPPRPPGSPDLLKVLAKMMAKDPGSRYQTPVELIADLQPVADERMEPVAEDDLPKVCQAASGATFNRSQPNSLLSTIRRASPSTSRGLTAAAAVVKTLPPAPSPTIATNLDQGAAPKSRRLSRAALIVASVVFAAALAATAALVVFRPWASTAASNDSTASRLSESHAAFCDFGCTSVTSSFV